MSRFTLPAIVLSAALILAALAWSLAGHDALDSTWNGLSFLAIGLAQVLTIAAALVVAGLGMTSLHATRHEGVPGREDGRPVMRVGSRVTAELTEEEWSARASRRSRVLTGAMLAFPAFQLVLVLGCRRSAEEA